MVWQCGNASGCNVGGGRGVARSVAARGRRGLGGIVALGAVGQLVMMQWSWQAKWRCCGNCVKPCGGLVVVAAATAGGVTQAFSSFHGM